MWTDIDGISLAMKDKVTLTLNEWLNDYHISEAQCLLWKQYPSI